jgi:uncharacterized membrane protein YhfC
MDFHYITFPLNALLMIAMPILLAIYLARKFGLEWEIWLIGGATFILSQVGHIPFNAGLNALFRHNILPLPPSAWLVTFNAVVGGLSAGLWEELSRYAMFRWWLKDARSWRKGVFAGSGHGGAEAIILGILVLVTFFQLSAYRNVDLTAIVPSAQLATAQAQIASYWATPWYATLLGAVERFFTIPTHIALSVIVLQTFIRKQWFWVWLAVLYHAFLDASIVFLLKPLGMYWIEALVGGFAVLSMIIIFSLRQSEPDVPQSVSVSRAPVPTLKPVEETPDNLDNSKYQ